MAYPIVDVLERLAFFARYAASAHEVLRYYAARLPLLVLRVVPMALLLATALTVSLLSVHHELLGMRACGISPTRALLLILACGVVAPFYFALQNKIVPQATALWHAVKNIEIQGRTGPTTLLAAVALALGIRAGGFGRAQLP